MTLLFGGVLVNQCSVWEGQNNVCALFFYALRSVISCFLCSTTHLLHLTQAQNIHTAVELAACRSGVFDTTLLPNGSDKRQQSGRIKAVDKFGCWFESGWCVGGLMANVC